MNAARIDVLAVMSEGASHIAGYREQLGLELPSVMADDLTEARAAVADLIEAAKQAEKDVAFFGMSTCALRAAIAKATGGKP